jgi:hypothetical protein
LKNYRQNFLYSDCRFGDSGQIGYAYKKGKKVWNAGLISCQSLLRPLITRPLITKLSIGVQMVKIKSRILKLLFVFFILLTGCVVNSQPAPSAKVPSEIAAPIQSQQELARAVLSEAGIAKQYDLYLGNGIDLALNPETARNPKFVAWMEALLVREAGWKYIESKYVAKLEATFSEAELRELLDLAKRPLMKKLLQAEIASYINATGERRRLLSKLWDDYNGGLFTPPPEIMQ